MQVVILAGGLGTRLSEETSLIPKPMVRIGGVPILIHIMQIFHSFGHTDFIISAGYKADHIRRYFMDKQRIIDSLGWNLAVVDTGLQTGTLGRISKLKNVLEKTFWVTYGDGLATVNLDDILKFHVGKRSIATLTAVRPPARFGSLEISDGIVTSFREKNPQDVGWINGGFMLMPKSAFSALEDEKASLEGTLLTNLSNSGLLSAFQHKGWWHPMDTLRDKNELEELFKKQPELWMREYEVLRRFC